MPGERAHEWLGAEAIDLLRAWREIDDVLLSHARQLRRRAPLSSVDLESRGRDALDELGAAVRELPPLSSSRRDARFPADALDLFWTLEALVLGTGGMTESEAAETVTMLIGRPPRPPGRSLPPGGSGELVEMFYRYDRIAQLLRGRSSEPDLILNEQLQFDLSVCVRSVLDKWSLLSNNQRENFLRHFSRLSRFAFSALCNAWLERLNDLLTADGLVDLLTTAARMYVDNTSEFWVELRRADVGNGLGDALLTLFMGESMHHAVAHLVGDLQWIIRDLVRLDA